MIKSSNAPNKADRALYIWAFVETVIVTLALIFACLNLADETVLIFLTVFLTVFTFYYIENGTAKMWKTISYGGILGFGLASAILICIIIVENIIYPHEWDFLCFYLDGNVALRGLDFYQPQNYADVLRDLSLPFSPSESFMTEIIPVGFKFPPPTMLYFLPLGLFSYQTAQIFWHSLNSIVLVLNIFLIWKMFLRQSGFIGWVVTLTLILIIPSSDVTVYHAQTTFILLLWLLLFWHDRNNPRAGIWSALALFTKPVAAPLLVLLFLRRQWVAGGIGLSCIASIILIAGLAFGFEIFASYINLNFLGTIPDLQWTQWVNQSLLSTILRATNYEFGTASPLTHPLFILIGGGVILTSFAIAYALDADNGDKAIAIMVAMAIIVYPSVMPSYGTILIPSMLVIGEFWQWRRDRNGAIMFAAFCAAVCTILNIIPIISHAMVWLALVLICTKTIVQKNRKLNKLSSLFKFQSQRN